MDKYREQINKIDQHIIFYLEKRMGLAELIGQHKRENDLPVKDPKREAAIIKMLQEQISEEYSFIIRPIYQQIFQISSYLQEVKEKTYGLVGQGLSHTMSPAIHKHFAYDYHIFDLNEEDFESLMEAKAFDGVNITLPYKVKALAYAEEIDPACQRIGSANTLVNRDGRIYAYNTDYQGLAYLLDREGINLGEKKVLIMGSGGASLTCQALAQDQGAEEIRVLSRTGPYNYENIEESKNFDILINATPVGMFPDNDGSLVDLDIFENLEAVVDLIYNPLKTRLLGQAQAKGLKAAGGLAMLVAQAFYACQFFTGYQLDPSLIEDILRDLTWQMKNLVLIGMPGSGKTSLGQALADYLDRPFYDTDQVLEARSGLTCQDFIEKKGIGAFRKEEARIVVEYSKQTGQVISTGGGAILLEDNRQALSQNGFFIFLDRDLDKLETKGRPLSQDMDSLKRLYKERISIYRSLADLTIQVEEDIDKTMNELVKGIEDEYTGN